MASARHRGPHERGAGDRLVAIGAVLFLGGLVAIVAVFVPFLFGENERGVPLSVATFFTSAGLGFGLLGLVRSARANRRTPDTHDPT